MRLPGLRRRHDSVEVKRTLPRRVAVRWVATPPSRPGGGIEPARYVQNDQLDLINRQPGD